MYLHQYLINARKKRKKTEAVNGNDRPSDCRLCGQEVRATVGRLLSFPYPVSDNNQTVTPQMSVRVLNYPRYKTGNDCPCTIRSR